jgi:hypothetical protein
LGVKHAPQVQDPAIVRVARERIAKESVSLRGLSGSNRFLDFHNSPVAAGLLGSARLRHCREARERKN